jgi:hypothetical protein
MIPNLTSCDVIVVVWAGPRFSATAAAVLLCNLFE